MKIKELIQKLCLLDSELEVICYSEDSNLLPPKHGLRLLEITGITVAECEQHRGDDRVVTLKIGKSSISTNLAIIEVTSDF